MATRTQAAAFESQQLEPIQRTQSRHVKRSQRLLAGATMPAPLLGAALAGAAIGVAANFGRKALMQGMEATAGDWDEILAAEHDMALAMFDKMLATDADPDIQAQDAADEADPRARQACATRRRWSSIRRCAKPTRRPTPTSSRASMATSRPSSTSSTRWARTRPTGSRRCASSAQPCRAMRIWRRSRSSRAFKRDRRGAERADHQRRQPRRLLDGMIASADQARACGGSWAGGRRCPRR